LVIENARELIGGFCSSVPQFSIDNHASTINN